MLVERREGATTCFRCCPLPFVKPCPCTCHSPGPAQRVRLVIPTPCSGKNSRRVVRFGSRPGLIKSEQALETEADVRARILFAVRGCALPLFGLDEVEVRLRYFPERELCEVVVERIGPPPAIPNWRRRDVGNLHDVVLDAMQRVAFANDNQVARLVVERVSL